MDDESGQLVTIDDYGDFVLRVGADDKLKTYKVHSTTLRRTSAVFRAMLFGPWIESRKPDADSKAGSDEWTVDLPDDHPDSFTILLGIAHARFDLVPKPDGWTKQSVNGVAVLADKYDMLHLLSPFASAMVHCIGHGSKLHIDEESLLNLQTSWELGSEEVFVKELKNIILLASLSNEEPNQLICQRSVLGVACITDLSEFLATENTEQIAQKRLHILTQLVSCINECYSRHQESGISGCLEPDGRSSECHTAVKEGLERTFRWRMGRPGLPDIKAEVIDRSIQSLYRSCARSLNPIRVPPGHESTCHPMRKLQDLWAGFKADEWDPKHLLTQEQREWMEQRRERIEY